MKAERNIGFKGIGDNDQLPYAQADIVKVCRMNDNYAISFYQLDYQAVANALSGISTIKPEESKLLPVSKVVMNPTTFTKLIDELVTLKKKVESENL